jgi:hypothetical protein
VGSFRHWFMVSVALSLRRIAEAADFWRIERKIEIEVEEEEMGG